MTALPKPAYVMSEPHLSGWRVVLGYETLADAQAAQSAVSVPEAREEALGNLLAVIHGDGGHRALEVGTKQAALEAEKIVAGLFAAPSADKLRIALEEAADAVDFFDRVKAATGAERTAVGSDHWNRMEAALRALAALKAEGC